MMRLVMTKAERSAMADALRHMRGVGLRGRDLLTLGASKHSIYAVAAKPRDTLRVRR